MNIIKLKKTGYADAKKGIIFLCVVFLCLLSAGPVFAGLTEARFSASSGSWCDGSKWDIKETPCESVLAKIENNGIVTVDGAGSAGGLYIGDAEGTHGGMVITSEGELGIVSDMVMGCGSGTASAAVTHSGGAVTVNNDLNMYHGAAYDITSGSLVVKNDMKLVSDMGETNAPVVTQTGGIVEIQGAQLTLQQYSGYNLQGGTLIVNRIQEIDPEFMAGTATFTMTGGRLQGAENISTTLDSYTAEFHQYGGTLAPGNSAGTTYINGRYILDAAGFLELEIFGPDQGVPGGYDFLDINGNALLNGTIVFLVDPAYEPVRGTIFDLISTTGFFTNNATVVGLPRGWSLEVIDNPKAGGWLLRATVVPEPGTAGMALFGLFLMPLFRKFRK